MFYAHAEFLLTLAWIVWETNAFVVAEANLSDEEISKLVGSKFNAVVVVVDRFLQTGKVSNKHFFT
jgi:hypothetical protein